MAKDTQNQVIEPRNSEIQSGSGSQQQINRGKRFGSSPETGDTQSSSQHTEASIPGSLCDRVDIPGVISQRGDTLPNPPGEPGTASSQYSTAVSTETGSDGFRVTIPPPDSHPVWEGVLDPAVLEKLGSDRKT